jgi:uncharacterized phage-associated protein
MTLTKNENSDTFDQEKFREIVHFFIHKTSGIPNVGKTVLYKLHYFSDFDYYEINEIKMTNERYSKIEHGPAPRHFNQIVDELIADNKIEQKTMDYFGHMQIRYCSLREPELTHLNATELRHLENTLCKYSTMNATQIEALSHKDLPWQATEQNEDINYDLVFYRDPEMSVRDYPNDGD